MPGTACTAQIYTCTSNHSYFATSLSLCKLIVLNLDNCTYGLVMHVCELIADKKVMIILTPEVATMDSEPFRPLWTSIEKHESSWLRRCPHFRSGLCIHTSLCSCDNRQNLDKRGVLGCSLWRGSTMTVRDTSQEGFVILWAEKVILTPEKDKFAIHRGTTIELSSPTFSFKWLLSSQQ